jgi:hypothetical protein
VDFKKFPVVDRAMLHKVGGIKARAARPQAEAWVKQDVEVTGKAATLRETITERMLRAPKATFVYDVQLR